MRYCRRCCADTEKTDYRRQSWDAASSIGGKYLPSKIAPPQTIHQFPRVRSRALLGFAFLKGLLAVHQAGGEVALLHPFRGGDDQSSLVWQDREGFESPTDVRSFTPLLLANQRHIVFSSPCGISVLNCWSLPDWHFEGATEYRVLVAADIDTVIVTAPVQLSATQLGFLTWNLDSREYRWHVIELTSPVRRFTKDKSQGITLPLQGAPCQLQALGQEFVTFATSEGHWVWRAADAAIGQVQGLKCTHPIGSAPANYELKLDSHIENPTNFRHPAQFTTRAGSYIEWYFQQKSGNVISLDFYRIDAKTLEPWAVSDVTPEARYIPLGRHSAIAQEPVVLAQGSHLKFATMGGSTVSSVPGFSPIDDFDSAAGLVFSDPFILSIHRTAVPGERRLAVRSLAAPVRILEIAVRGLLAEPLNWSNWLFTAEVADNQIQIRRHDLQATGDERA